MAIVDLDRRQGLALLEEMTSTRNLLAYGTGVLRGGAFLSTTRDPVLTMLSIGVEKLYKLTLGLVALDRHHEWPAKSEMQRWGHNLVLMHSTIMRELVARTADQSEYVRGFVAGVAHDPLVGPVLEALDRYGRMGRFYNLDELGNAPQAVSPVTAWQKVEQSALADPQVAELYRQAMGNVADGEAWTGFAGALRERIARTVDRIWSMVAVCGRNHVLGETGVVFGFEIHPDRVADR